MTIFIIGIQSVYAQETDRYMVVLKDDVGQASRSSLIMTVGMTDHVNINYAFNGFITSGTPQQMMELEYDSRVLFIQKDFQLELQAQLTPTGIARIESPHVGTGYVSNARIIIMDTGLAPNHPDLNVVGGKNFHFDKPRDMWMDVHGHGTQVAGVAAACDNDIGVVGVAPCAELTAYRIYDDDGRGGHASTIIAAIDDIILNAEQFDVINMSFGISQGRLADTSCGVISFDVLHQAICRLRDAGIVVVAAAGNDRMAADFFIPAAYTDAVIAVSALTDGDGLPGGLQSPSCRFNDQDDSLASYSNFGFIVDVIAPGSCIRTTHPDGGLITMSGTSFAAPHVAGWVADYIAQNGKTDWLTIKSDMQDNGFPYLSAKGWTGDKDEFHEPLLSADVTPSAPETAPIAFGDSYFDYISGTTIVMDILSNDIDAENNIDPSTVFVWGSRGGGQELIINADGTISYTNNKVQDTVFRDFFWYEVRDITGLRSNPTWVKINVNPAPEPEHFIIKLFDGITINDKATVVVSSKPTVEERLDDIEERLDIIEGKIG